VSRGVDQDARFLARKPIGQTAATSLCVGGGRGTRGAQRDRRGYARRTMARAPFIVLVAWCCALLQRPFETSALSFDLSKPWTLSDEYNNATRFDDIFSNIPADTRSFVVAHKGQILLESGRVA
jgi:hypothetical protein